MTVEQEHRLDLADVRAKLRAEICGKQYWRTLEELADDPHFEDLLHREFPRQAFGMGRSRGSPRFPEVDGSVAGLRRPCRLRPSSPNNIVPYVKQPDGMILGKPHFYATAMPFGADAVGVLVESHEGRPTKIEGNPDHPSSLGATNAFAQASILNLYDPDRSQTVSRLGEIRSLVGFPGCRARPCHQRQGHQWRGLPHP